MVDIYQKTKPFWDRTIFSHFSTALANIIYNMDNFNVDSSSFRTIDNKGRSGVTYDGDMCGSNHIALNELGDVGQNVTIPTTPAVLSMIYFDVLTKSFISTTNYTLTTSFSQAVTLDTVVSQSDIDNLNIYPDDLRRMQDHKPTLGTYSFNKSNIQGQYDGGEGDLSDNFIADIADNSGTFYFSDSNGSENIIFRSPAGTSLTVNGTVYFGNDDSSVTIPSISGGATFIESVDGCITYFKYYNSNLSGNIPDLSSNTNLSNFYCQNNQLTGNIPDLSNNTKLYNFICNNNQLTGFEGGNITISSDGQFDATYNALPQTIIDALLQALVDGNTQNCTIHLYGGDNEAPSSAGEANIDTLRNDRACVVEVTGGY